MSVDPHKGRIKTEEIGGEFLFYVLAGGWVLDPGRWNGAADVWIKDGLIEAVVSPDVRPPDDAVCVDVTGLLVLPGLVDLHVHLREPGYEYKETIATGTAAAVAGGFTSLCCMPNAKPVNDHPTVTQRIRMKASETGHAKSHWSHYHGIGWT